MSAALALVGALSFNGNKIVTTGGGGAILTDNDELAKRAKHMTTTAKLGHKWAFNHDDLGYNYRLPNLNAAMGCAQLEQIPEFLAAKRHSCTVNTLKVFRCSARRTAFLLISPLPDNYLVCAMLIDEASG